MTQTQDQDLTPESAVEAVEQNLPKNEGEKSEVELIREEFEKIKAQNDEHLKGWQRAKADYLNLKKETEKKSLELVQYANAGLILQVLPIYENFKSAWEYISEEDRKKDWVVGVGHIKKQLEDLLHSLGLEPIKTVGEKFDSTLHEAVGTEKMEGKEDDEIIKEVRGGFRLYGKVLEIAKVIVVKN